MCRHALAAGAARAPRGPIVHRRALQGPQRRGAPWASESRAGDRDMDMFEMHGSTWGTDETKASRCGWNSASPRLSADRSLLATLKWIPTVCQDGLFCHAQASPRRTVRTCGSGSGGKGGRPASLPARLVRNSGDGQLLSTTTVTLGMSGDNPRRPPIVRGDTGRPRAESVRSSQCLAVMVRSPSRPPSPACPALCG